MNKPKILSGPIKTVLLKYPRSETVAIHLRIKAGSNYESKSYVGAAHLLEHLLSKCNSEDKDCVGNGKMYGVTSRDNVLYLIVGIKKDWTKFIHLLGNLVKKEDFSETDINLQKHIITQEINRYKGNPEKYITRVSYRNVFPNSRMTILNSGEVSDVNAITMRKLIEFKRSFYVRSNMSITAAGDLKESELREVVKSVFTGIKSRGQPYEVKLKENPALDVQIISSETYSQAYVKISFIGREIKHKNRLFNELMAYMVRKFLTRELRDGKGITYRVFCDSFSSGNFGVTSIGYTVPDKKLISSIKSVKRTLDKIDLTTNLLDVAKDEMILDKMLGFEKLSVAADYYSDLLLFDGPSAFRPDISRAIREVRIPDIKREFNYTFGQKPKFTILTKNYNTGYLKRDIKEAWKSIEA